MWGWDLVRNCCQALACCQSYGLEPFKVLVPIVQAILNGLSNPVPSAPGDSCSGLTGLFICLLGRGFFDLLREDRIVNRVLRSRLMVKGRGRNFTLGFVIPGVKA